MALNKLILNNAGHGNSYHCITDIKIDKDNGRLLWTVRNYKDQDARKNKLDYDFENLECDDQLKFSPVELDKLDNNVYKIAFSIMLESEKYSGATNI